LAQTVHLPDCYGWIALRVGADVPAAVADALTPGMTVFVHRDLDLAVYAVKSDQCDLSFRDVRAPTMTEMTETMEPSALSHLATDARRDAELAMAVLGRIVREGVWGTTCVAASL